MKFEDIKLNKREKLLYEVCGWPCVKLADEWFLFCGTSYSGSEPLIIHVCRPLVWEKLQQTADHDNELGKPKTGLIQDDPYTQALAHLWSVKDEKCQRCETTVPKHVTSLGILIGLGIDTC